MARKKKFMTSTTEIPASPRGYTQMQSIWKLKAGEKLEIALNAKGCPVRKSRYTRFIGTVARRSSLCPLNYLRWSKLPKELKDSIWNDVIEPRFIVPVEHATNIKKWTVEAIGKKWRRFKHNLKKKCFDFNKSEDENVQVVAEDRLKDGAVDRDQYRFLVRYWLSNEGKDISKKNKANIRGNDEPNCAGSIAFRGVAEELVNPSSSRNLAAKLDEMASQIEAIKRHQVESIERIQRQQAEKIQQMQRVQDEKIKQIQRKHVEEIKEMREMIRLVSELHSLSHPSHTLTRVVIN